MHRLLLVSFILCYSMAAQAFVADQPLENTRQEQLAQDLFRQVRCVVCKGQSLADSNAAVAEDMRREIRAQIVTGKNSDAIMQYLIQRYGEEIRMRPAFKNSMALWLAPLVFLLVGFFIVRASFIRRQH